MFCLGFVGGALCHEMLVLPYEVYMYIKKTWLIRICYISKEQVRFVRIYLFYFLWFVCSCGRQGI